jgi:transporter family protein
MSAVYLAILAAVSFGLWTVFHKIAAPHINQIVGAIVVSAVAVIVGLIALAPKIKDVHLFEDWRGIVFVALAGIAAFFIDYLALSAYGKGLPVSVGGPIIIGGSIALASIIGFFMGESMSLLKVIALILIIGGSGLLAYLSK